MRRPRSERMPFGQPGIWHVVSRCVRRQRLLEGEGCREWLSSALASWLEVLAVDCLGYALMGNHVHLILRTRPDVAAGWTAEEVRRRWSALGMVSDGRPAPPGKVRPGPALGRGELDGARKTLSHPGAMLRAVKEGYARRLNRRDQTAGHVWESRYQDVALLDAGGVLACQVYVDLNPFRAGLVEVPGESAFCSARHRLRCDMSAPDAALGRLLVRDAGHPLLDSFGQPVGTWSWTSEALAELTFATARCIRPGGGVLPAWAEELLPRLGVEVGRWAPSHSRPGLISGNVLASYATRAALPGARRPSDKSGLFGRLEKDQV
jgi:hypothetical protein